VENEIINTEEGSMAFSEDEKKYIEDLLGLINRLGTDKFVDWLGVIREIQIAIKENDDEALKSAMIKVPYLDGSMSGEMLEMEILKKAVEAIKREIEQNPSLFQTDDKGQLD
jgi:hypothetical protein